MTPIPPEVTSPPHVLTITRLIWTDDDGVEREDWEYEIEHHPDCTEVVTITRRKGQPLDIVVEHQCLLQYHLENVGLTSVAEEWGEGTFVVEGFMEKIVGPTWTEYDSGIRLCSEPDEKVLTSTTRTT
jgi:hypothetical protein